ncbi:cyclin-T1-4-like isoform X1 [Amaranthus tricolor]|uniref:cyclin-T1-4-like isoform X1 n=1 Tax=Amaranthus tricolor TaxID=29722 RepID=UPI002588EF0C|nr:cyclin-T1-4-like isoform X1 [Amaranthus tricolor]
MSYGRSYQPQGGTLFEFHGRTFPRNQNYDYMQNEAYYNCNRYNQFGNRIFDDMRRHDFHSNVPGNCRERAHQGNYYRPHHVSPSSKRRKLSENAWGSDGASYCQSNHFVFSTTNPSAESLFFPATAATSTSSHCHTVGKRGRSDLEDEECAIFMSKEEIERCSPSRKDGIDVLHETRLRYSYCGFIHNLGMRLDLPQTTMGTAMVLCHRFFVRRSHACHDRFLIATAAVFLAAKSEETIRPLNDVLKSSCEILHNQNFSFYMLSIDWFEQYRERIIEAEQLILTTLNFELSVQHPYDTLTLILNKLGVSQTHLMNLALNLVSEGFRSSLWLQFKPHQIAAGVVYVAAKMLNMNFDSCLSIWQEFQTPPAVLQDVAQQLMELFSGTNMNTW